MTVAAPGGRYGGYGARRRTGLPGPDARRPPDPIDG
jgi:hypothetical protein